MREQNATGLHKNVIHNYLRDLDGKGKKYSYLISYEKGQIWNKDSKLMRFVIFKYDSPESLQKCLPIWREIEKQIFQSATVKVTAYRGVTTEYWESD